VLVRERRELQRRLEARRLGLVDESELALARHQLDERRVRRLPHRRHEPMVRPRLVGF
jgi:hypothetical protein